MGSRAAGIGSFLVLYRRFYEASPRRNCVYHGICNHVGSAVKSLYISYVLLNTMEKTQKSAKLSWINLSELNIPGEFLIESRLICGQISLTIATDKSLHDLITGKDIRERPVIPDLVWFNLWGDESGN